MRIDPKTRHLYFLSTALALNVLGVGLNIGFLLHTHRVWAQVTHEAPSSSPPKTHGEMTSQELHHEAHFPIDPKIREHIDRAERNYQETKKRYQIEDDYRRTHFRALFGDSDFSLRWKDEALQFALQHHMGEQFEWLVAHMENLELNFFKEKSLQTAISSGDESFAIQVLDRLQARFPNWNFLDSKTVTQAMERSMERLTFRLLDDFSQSPADRGLWLNQATRRGMIRVSQLIIYQYTRDKEDPQKSQFIFEMLRREDSNGKTVFDLAPDQKTKDYFSEIYLQNLNHLSDTLGPLSKRSRAKRWLENKLKTR